MSNSTNYIDELARKIRAETPPDALPDASDLDMLFRLYALLARVKGEAVTARDVHDAWSVWVLNRGDNHESVLPFEALAPETRAEDEPFAEAIRRAAP